MRTDEFWVLVDQARAGAPDGVDGTAQRLVAGLADRPPAQIAGFDRHLRRVLAASHRADLWGAAYLVNGGCSDEGFAAFRGWLVGQGRAAFAGAVADPDTLAQLGPVQRAAETGAELESPAMLVVATRAYATATGASLPPDPDPVPVPELADFWDFDDEDEMRRRFPRLAALFLEPPQE